MLFLLLLLLLPHIGHLAGLIRARKTVRGEDYSPSVRAVIGKSTNILIYIVIILYLFGVFIQNQVIFYYLIGKTVYEFFSDKNQYIKFWYNTINLFKIKIIIKDYFIIIKESN